MEPSDKSHLVRVVELAEVFIALGRPDLALPLLQRLVAAEPDEPGLELRIAEVGRLPGPPEPPPPLNPSAAGLRPEELIERCLRAGALAVGRDLLRGLVRRPLEPQEAAENLASRLLAVERVLRRLGRREAERGAVARPSVKHAEQLIAQGRLFDGIEECRLVLERKNVSTEARMWVRDLEILLAPVPDIFVPESGAVRVLASPAAPIATRPPPRREEPTPPPVEDEPAFAPVPAGGAELDLATPVHDRSTDPRAAGWVEQAPSVSPVESDAVFSSAPADPAVAEASWSEPSERDSSGDTPLERRRDARSMSQETTAAIRVEPGRAELSNLPTAHGAAPAPARDAGTRDDTAPARPSVAAGPDDPTGESEVVRGAPVYAASPQAELDEAAEEPVGEDVAFPEDEDEQTDLSLHDPEVRQRLDQGDLRGARVALARSSVESRSPALPFYLAAMDRLGGAGPAAVSAIVTDAETALVGGDLADALTLYTRAADERPDELAIVARARDLRFVLFGGRRPPDPAPRVELSADELRRVLIKRGGVALRMQASAGLWGKATVRAEGEE